MATRTLFTDDFKARPYWWEAAEPDAAWNGTPLPEAVDVCIVGGGYTGLSCALELARNGVSCLVLDALRIGEGASSRNGGLVTGGVKVALSALSSGAKADRQARLVDEAIGTLRFVSDLIAREGIDCDLAQAGRFNCAYSPKHYDAMARTTERLAEATGAAAYMVPRERQHEEIGSDFYCGGQVLEAGATLHPGKYVRGLAQAAAAAGATLAGGTQVTRVERAGGDWRVETSRGTVRSKSLVVGTNGYTGGEFPWLRRRVVPVASFLIATEELPEGLAREISPKARAMSDSCRVLNYFRLSPDGRRVLWGGRVGTRAMDERESGRRLHEKMCRAWPQLRDVRISHSWHGNVAFTFDYLPHIGQHRDVHYALGCQGNGIAMQSWLGYQLGRQVLTGASESAFGESDFQTRPLYGGDPWFLPAVLAWYALRDKIDRSAA